MAWRVPRYSTLRWAFAGVVALHNFEEWLTFPTYGEVAVATARRLGMTLVEPPWPFLQAALIGVTLLPAAAVVLAAMRPNTAWRESLVAFFVSIFLANVFVPHVPAAVLAGGYAPGVVTAVAVNLPFGILYFRAASREGVLTHRAVARLLVAALATLVALGSIALSGLIS